MKPFLLGKKNLGVDPLRPPGVLAATAASRCDPSRNGGSNSPHGSASAQVEVVKEGDKVVRLIVTCLCGERVEIECLYSAGR